MKITQNPKMLCRQLNLLQKNSKAFDRDEFFITTIAKSTQPTLQAIVIEINKDKQYIKLWVKESNRIIRMKTIVGDDYVEAKDGTRVPVVLKEKVKLTYHVNYEKAQWKDKIIFGIHNA
jgi:hypothetical protein